MKTAQISTKTIESKAGTAPASLDLPRIFGTTWEKLQSNYYSVIVMTILVGSMVSGIAAANLLRVDGPTWELALVAFFGMFNNTTAIGNMSIRWVVWSFVLSLAANILFIAINL